MKFDVEDYDINNGNSFRLEIVPNKDVESDLLYRYSKDGAEIVAVWDLIPSETRSFPKPSEMLKIIDSVASETRIVVKGLSAYIKLLDQSTKDIMITALKRKVEYQNKKQSIILRSAELPAVLWSNPKYVDSLQVVYFNGPEIELPEPNISWSPSEYDPNLTNNKFGDIVRYVYELESTSFNDPIVGHIDSNNYSLQGVSKNYSAITTPREFLFKTYSYDIGVDLDQNDPFILEFKQSSCKTIQEFLNLKTNISNDKKSDLKKIVNLKKDKNWPIYLRFVKNRLEPGTFLQFVINNCDLTTDILYEYVISSSIAVLNEPIDILKRYAEERFESLKYLPDQEYQFLIIQFISLSKIYPNAIYFMNFGLIEEKEELLRRIHTSDVSEGLNPDIKLLFPELETYLSPYDYGNEELTDYFKKYRKYKLNNELPLEFLDVPESIKIPSNIQMRDNAISKYADVEGVKLLTVDALGAEYLPFLSKMLKEKNFNIEEEKIVQARLPSSTQFNPISWTGSRIEEIKSLDNNAHNGAIKNEKTTIEQNLCESFRVLTVDLPNRISENISSCSKIIITADHGLSRLVVLAQELSLAKSIDCPIEDPDDWRYTKVANANEIPPSCIERQTFDGVPYWVIKSYDRFKKKGGKIYELHGGATPEERLVPFIVVSNSNVPVIKKEPVKKSQIIITDDLDI